MRSHVPAGNGKSRPTESAQSTGSETRVVEPKVEAAGIEPASVVEPTVHLQACPTL